MKRIGFLSFGHWTPAPYSEVRTASDLADLPTRVEDRVGAVGGTVTVGARHVTAELPCGS